MCGGVCVGEACGVLRGLLAEQQQKQKKVGSQKKKAHDLCVRACCFFIYADTAGMREPTARNSHTLKSGLVDAALSVHVPDE